MARLASNYTVSALTVFLSAFLLFAIQPIASKHLLPYFGGSSSVWATSLLFFTTTLFLGYAYVYFLTTRTAKTQILVHGIVIAVATLVSLGIVLTSGSLYPSLDWMLTTSFAPSLRVLIALLAAIGLPYFLLATTGPLIQYWYGMSSEVREADASLGTSSDNGVLRPVISRSPYTLYALSNAGSLLALVSYPFVIEPYIPLPTEEVLWIALFVVYAVLLGIIAASLRNTPIERARAEISGSYPRTLSWIGYAALPAFLLVAVTTVITQLISPVPLLWIVPLAIYLLTFILAFSGAGKTVYMPLFVMIAAFAAYMYTPASPREIIPHVSSYLTFLFFACILCHAKLYELRPATLELPFFYLCVSLGGAIGTLLASIVAPLAFNDFWEFAVGLAVTAALAGFVLSPDFFPRIMKERTIRMIKIVFPFFIAMILANVVTANASPSTLTSRNFYGTVQLKFEDEATVLQHGTTVHGLQPTAREWSYVPTTYYTPNSGIGRAMQYTNDRLKGSAKHVAIVGLGTGTIATYCDQDDVFIFFEIDPRIKDIASSHFSYLNRCEHSGVKIGDGRLLLQKERDEALPGYDVVAVDAFTDDSIPAHLLTTEAIDLYMNRLRTKQGIVAIHTSNRYLSLAPMLLSITRERGLTAMIVNDSGDSGHLGSSSQWVLLSRDASAFDAAAFIGVRPWDAPSPLPAPWTDTYTSLFSVLNLPN